MRRLALGALVLFLASSSFAATRTWTGAVSALWSNAGNWGGTAPVAGDDLVFPTGASNQTNTNDFAAGTSFHSISLTAGNYTLGGNSVSIGAGGITSSAGTNIINFNQIVNIAQTWTNSGGSLTVNGTLALGGVTLTLNDSGGNGTLNSAISGTGTLALTGGFFYIRGTSTFAGAATNSGGDFAVNTGTVPVPYSQTAGSLDLSTNGTIGNVTITGGAFNPGEGGSGEGNTGNLTLAPGVTYGEVINFSGAGSFGSTTATGTVNLNGASLVLGGIGSLTAGDQLIIIANDGTDPVVGTFAGLPEGAVISNGPGGNSYKISYVGGTGNDVVLTVVSSTALTATTTQLFSSVNPSAEGQDVTFTADIEAPGTFTPGGTVTFMDGGNPIAVVAVTSSSATFTTSLLTVGSHTMSASFSGNTALAGSTSAPLVQQVVAAIPALDQRALIGLAVALAGAALLLLRRS